MGRAKFNDRHAEALVRRQKQGAAASHRENDRYMADFRSGYGLAAPAEPAGGLRGAACAFARASRRGAIERSTRPRPTRSGGARATRAARSSTAATGRSSQCPCRTTAPTSSRGGADHAAHGVDVARAGARPQRQYHGKARGHHEWVTGVAHCGGRSVATCGADGRLCLWRSPHARGARHRGRRGVALRAAGRRRAAAALLAAGYDGTARLFDVGGRRARGAGRLAPGGRRPRAGLCAAWDRDTRGLGDRDGRVLVYDLTTCSRTRLLRLPAAGEFCGTLARHSPVAFHHAGPTRRRATSRALRGRRPPRERPPGRPRAGLGRATATTGPAWTAPAHRGRAGAGAASCVAALADDALVATCGADRRVCVVDPRRRTRPSAFREHRDFP